MLRPYKGNGLIGRGALAAVASEGPANAEGRIKAVGAIGSQIRGAERFVVAAEPIHLMLRGAQLEILRQLKTDSNGTLVCDGRHGRGVDLLRKIISKTEFWFEEEIQMTCRSAAERLQLYVSAEKIARVGSAEGSRSAGAGRLRIRAAAEIGFVVGRRHFEIRVAANPIVRKKCPRLFRRLGSLAGLDRLSLQSRARNK